MRSQALFSLLAMLLATAAIADDVTIAVKGSLKTPEKFPDDNVAVSLHASNERGECSSAASATSDGSGHFGFTAPAALAADAHALYFTFCAQENGRWVKIWTAKAKPAKQAKFNCVLYPQNSCDVTWDGRKLKGDDD